MLVILAQPGSQGYTYSEQKSNRACPDVSILDLRAALSSTPLQFRGRTELGTGDLEALDDLALVERLKWRDSRAFEVLYDRYVRLAFAVALRVLPKRESAEEVVQDVYVKLWRQPSLYDPTRGAFRPWLLRVVHHRAIDELRHANRDRMQTADDPEGFLWDTIADPGPGPEDAAASAVERDKVLDAVDQLAASQRDAIYLAFFDGLTHAEIAERLGEPLGTIKTRVRLGMRRMRDLLAA
jgi:RNA polymerase sigma-70 factor, ECF subfamily